MVYEVQIWLYSYRIVDRRCNHWNFGSDCRPSFLNAQTRAKVARCYAICALGTAFEMYNLDNNSYPFFGGNQWYSFFIYPALTTPIAYMSSSPRPFVIKDNPQRPNDHSHFYPGWNVFEVIKSGSARWTNSQDAVQSGARMLTVAGPDKHEDIASQTGLFPITPAMA